MVLYFTKFNKGFDLNQSKDKEIFSVFVPGKKNCHGKDEMMLPMAV